MPSEYAPLSAELRLRTRRAHRVAEQARFIRGFLRGTVTRTAYIGLLQRLHGLYDALESGLQANRDHPLAGPFWQPQLARTQVLAGDLQALGASPVAGYPSPATRAFRAHLRQCARDHPPLLAAHAYVRYLGDLSGGQLLQRVAVRSLGLKPGIEDNFYRFPDLPDLQQAKDDFRRRLDHLGAAAPDLREPLIQEAILSFGRNLSLFDELAPAPWLRLLRLVRPV